MGKIPSGFQKAGNHGYTKKISKSELLSKKAEVIEKVRSQKSAQPGKPEPQAVTKDGYSVKAENAYQMGRAEQANFFPTYSKIIPKAVAAPGDPDSDEPDEIDDAPQLAQADEAAPADEGENSKVKEKARNLLHMDFFPPAQKKVLQEILDKDEKKK